MMHPKLKTNNSSSTFCTDSPTAKLAVGISGASGFQYGICLLQILQQLNIESHLIVSKAAQMVRQYETSMTYQQVTQLASKVYAYEDISCALASGSFLAKGMIIAPCSMRTLGEIATGVTTNALTRAAEVTLKERRRLVLMVRETPLTKVHIENMLKVTEMGGIIAPPVPAFYNKPESLDDIIFHSVARVLDLFDINIDAVNRWRQEDLTPVD